MGRALSSVYAGLIAALALPAGEAAQAAGIATGRYQLIEDTQPAPPAPAPPANKDSPGKEVIKPKTDVDPQIEKNPPNPNPDPGNKDVIKPPDEGAGEPK